MKLISWNVNGLRAVLKKGFEDFFYGIDADVFCLQETKLQPEQNTFFPSGYHYFINSAVKKGYSGTAIYSKKEPLEVSYGLGIDAHDTEGRTITLEYDEFFLLNVYTPNSQPELARLDYRMEWDDAFRAYSNKLTEKKPLIICGDLNVAHKEIDLKRPKANVKNAGFTPQEREKFSLLLESGFVDSFRHFYPDTVDAYTWWSYIARARANNTGWRIDYFLASKDYSERMADAVIYADVPGSDHCPVGLELKK